MLSYRHRYSGYRQIETQYLGIDIDIACTDNEIDNSTQVQTQIQCVQTIRLNDQLQTQIQRVQTIRHNAQLQTQIQCVQTNRHNAQLQTQIQCVQTIRHNAQLQTQIQCVQTKRDTMLSYRHRYSVYRQIETPCLGIDIDIVCTDKQRHNAQVQTQILDSVQCIQTKTDYYMNLIGLTQKLFIIE